MEHEPLIRFSAFVGVLILVSIWESLMPRRTRIASRGKRFVNNLLLVAADTLCLRLIPAFSAVAAASWATENRFGLLNQLETPVWFEFILAFLALDLLIYGQHVVMHLIPTLWRIHRVHHADLDLDGTSGLRFHPFEILLSMGVKVVGVALLGAGVYAVIFFEIVLNATSIFNHGNIQLPDWCDRILRCLIVTPDMHRVHHSIRRRETDSNFGFNVPWWDWLFRTYTDQPQDPHENLPLGIPEFRKETETTPVIRMLWMPFRPLQLKTGLKEQDLEEQDPEMELQKN